MYAFDDEERSFLGIENGSAAELAVLEPPPAAADQGLDWRRTAAAIALAVQTLFAVAPRPPSPGEPEVPEEREPAPTPISLQPTALGPIPRELAGVDRIARTRDLLIHTGDAALFFRGEAHLLDLPSPRPHWLIRGDGPPVLARLASDRGDWALRFVEGRVEIYALDPGPDALARASDASSRAAAEVPAPPFEALVASFALAPWLGADARRLSESSLLSRRVAAVGLIARLWAPPRREATAVLQNGGPTPAAQVEAWSRALGTDAAEVVEHDALGPLDDLARSLRSLARRGEDEDVDPDSILALALARDDLESVSHALSLGGYGDLLRDALARLDAGAEHFAPARMALAADRLTASERLVSVSWQEPLAWWGAPQVDA